MPEYVVHIVQRREWDVYVEADDAQEAARKVWDGEADWDEHVDPMSEDISEEYTKLVNDKPAKE